MEPGFGTFTPFLSPVVRGRGVRAADGVGVVPLPDCPSLGQKDPRYSNTIEGTAASAAPRSSRTLSQTFEAISR